MFCTVIATVLHFFKAFYYLPWASNPEELHERNALLGRSQTWSRISICTLTRTARHLQCLQTFQRKWCEMYFLNFPLLSVSSTYPHSVWKSLKKSYFYNIVARGNFIIYHFMRKNSDNQMRQDFQTLLHYSQQVPTLIPFEWVFKNDVFCRTQLQKLFGWQLSLEHLDKVFKNELTTGLHR